LFIFYANAFGLVFTFVFLLSFTLGNSVTIMQFSKRNTTTNFSLFGSEQQLGGSLLGELTVS
jgi:hypothetical protein